MAGPRALAVTTPLGPDAFLLASLTGQEELSRLYTFELQVAAPSNRAVPFDQLLGRPVVASLTLPGRRPRYFAGICASFSEGGQTQGATLYQLELVPKLWLLTHSARSRIFQNKSVPEILSQVLQGVDFSLDLQGSYERRNYCVQYRESDFDFVSRL